MKEQTDYSVIVIGGGHAGAEAAWAAANMLRAESGGAGAGRVALITMDPEKIGVMSCNPAIGGLAKGQIVKEIDAMGGLMGLAADATGIQFRMLNSSKGAAVRGPRCQSDKYKYAREVQRLLKTRENLDILAGRVDDFIIENGRCAGVEITGATATSFPVGQLVGRASRPPFAEGEKCSVFGNQGGRDVEDAPRRTRPTTGATADCCGDFGACENDKPKAQKYRLRAQSVVLTTGTFMRGLMHTGTNKTEGGRVGEKSAQGISGALAKLGFELSRLKTGTPPRLASESIDFAALQTQAGDSEPFAFSEITDKNNFPSLAQSPCWVTHTNREIHEIIRANLHLAPMYNGQIETSGPRYCPSIEDKVVRFADRDSHHVFLEPESLETNEIYCNGISSSLPQEVQEKIVHKMVGCEKAQILRYGYAVEYDMVPAQQIDTTCMTKLVAGLFFAGQINGTTGYEEAGGQGLVAGINAALFAQNKEPFRLRRDQAYIGVLMDDLVTKIPREPYRMFTSRAEHRLLLRADNADERLTPIAKQLGLICAKRERVFTQKQKTKQLVNEYIDNHKIDDKPMDKWIAQFNVTAPQLLEQINPSELACPELDKQLLATVLADRQYAGYITRQQKDIQRLADEENSALPKIDFALVPGLRNEAAQTLNQFKPATMGQARRLAGVNPADLMLISVALAKKEKIINK